MKVGYIAKSNKKGQVVIPKKIRDALGITGEASLGMVVRDKGVYVYPIEEVLTPDEKNNSYLQVLERTQGAWREYAKEWEQLEKKRRKIELAASKRRKAW